MADQRHPSLNERADPAIRLVPFDPAWAAEFASEAVAVSREIGPSVCRVDHVGSTAVPGLAAKPIIDIQVSVERLEPQSTYVAPLERLGYLFAPDPDSPDFHFFGKPARRPRKFHVHVCQNGSQNERRHLAVRDYLRAHPEEVDRYAEVKLRIAAAHPGDRLAYIAGKTPFVEALEKRALAWAPSSP